MPRRFPILLLLALSLVSCASPTEPDQAVVIDPPVAGNATAQEVIDLTNARRTATGLPALAVNTRLLRAAQIQGEQLVAAGVLAHDLPEQRYPTLADRIAAAGYDWQTIGENIAFGQTTPAQVVEAWMNSSGHRANILNTNFTEIGASFARDGNGRIYWVQVFGRPR